MEFSWLEAFIELAQSDSIRACSKKLGISPSSVSARIQSLENYLGTTLFAKGAHGSALTPQGRVYLDYAKQLLKKWNIISDTVKQASETPSSSLDLAFQGCQKPSFIIRFLEKFTENHPNIVLNLYDDRDFSLAEGIESGKVDAYFTHNPPDSSGKGLAKQFITSCPLDILVPARHRLVSRNVININELEGETFILYPETKEPSLRNLQQSLLNSSEIRYSLFEGVAAPEYAPLYVQMNYGITFFPRNLSDVIPPKTSLIELNDEKFISTIFMVYRKSNPNPALKTFISEYNNEHGGQHL